MTTENHSLAHYRILLHVKAATSVLVAIEDETAEFGQFHISLGANAETPTEALALAESHMMLSEDGPVMISYVEIEALAFEAVPRHVVQTAFRDPSEPGVYWQSGRVFGQNEGDEGT